MGRTTDLLPTGRKNGSRPPSPLLHEGVREQEKGRGEGKMGNRPPAAALAHGLTEFRQRAPTAARGEASGGGAAAVTFGVPSRAAQRRTTQDD
jgi:hypothetical protein